MGTDECTRGVGELGTADQGRERGTCSGRHSVFRERAQGPARQAARRGGSPSAAPGWDCAWGPGSRRGRRTRSRGGSAPRSQTGWAAAPAERCCSCGTGRERALGASRVSARQGGGDTGRGSGAERLAECGGAELQPWPRVFCWQPLSIVLTRRGSGPLQPGGMKQWRRSSREQRSNGQRRRAKRQQAAGSIHQAWPSSGPVPALFHPTPAHHPGCSTRLQRCVGWVQAAGQSAWEGAGGRCTAA